MSSKPNSRSTADAPVLLDLALQGGGSHGAFTWGVLDRLLQEESLKIAGVSGSSAGAVNAVALAAGLTHGGRVGARATLSKVWERVGQAGVLAAPWQGWGVWWSHWQQAIWGMAPSPTQINPTGYNPLREILNDTIDFEAVRCCTRTRLYIGTTCVRTGELRLFREHEMSVDVVLASACLPQIFPAVEIDGETYWDGGFAGNPSLLPLIAQTRADDLLLVQINPRMRHTVPTQAQAIDDRVNEITFNMSLLKELRLLGVLKEALTRHVPGSGNPLLDRVARLRLHRIDAGEALAALGSSSKLRADWAFISRLRDAGHASADAWLARHRGDLGVRATLNASTDIYP